jgi:signal transduction histidine kinase
VVREEGPDPARAAAVPDLPDRLRRAVAELSSSSELSATLGHLLRVVGAGSGVERLVLVSVDGAPRELAAHPGPVASLDAHTRIAALVQEVVERGRAASDEPGVGGQEGPEGSEVARCRYAAPLRGDNALLAVLVGESASHARLEVTDEVVIEAIGTLLVPMLLVRERLESARELDRLRSDFIARVSHELRTPLTIITGFAGTLGAHEETLTTRQRHEMLDRIVTASIRLEHLIEEVLSLASVDAGLAEPQPKLVPVRDVVDLAIHDRGGTERVEVRGNERLKVFTDPDVARVVLGALIENALQQGEHVTVLIDGTGPEVRVAVEDDGPGVPPELGPRVFERFVRGDDRSPGMGLGLAIARRMAESIGARLWFEDVDAGARFVTELPAMQARPQSP